MSPEVFKQLSKADQRRVLRTDKLARKYGGFIIGPPVRRGKPSRDEFWAFPSRRAYALFVKACLKLRLWPTSPV